MPDRHAATEAFGVLCDMALPLGLTVNLEFVAWASCSTLAGAAEVIRAACRPNAGLLIDTFHFHHSHDRADALDRIPREWFHYAHVSDDRRGAPDDREDCKRRGREERLFPGEGAVDIAGILGRLPAHVVYAIELPHRRRLAELGPAEFARQCLHEMQRYLQTSSTDVAVSEDPIGLASPHVTNAR
jgi:sugar phosphate isomerase/epimerase